MNMTKWIMICLLAITLAPVGCGKKEYPKADQQTVTIDVPKLRDAFATASPDLKAISDEVIRDVQYGRSYSGGLAGLERLANAPGLTDDQKKIVAEVTDQVKKMMGGDAAAPAR